MFNFWIKRFLDFFASLVLLIVCLPLLIVTIMGLLVVNNGAIFFFQYRPGKNEVIFKIWKFKTMTDEKDLDGMLLPDNLRLTRFGKIIRKFSIDELPQLLNVLKGEMSLIGPRPLLVEYLPLYNQFQKKRHLVKPGITGLAQVSGRNAITWEEKFKLDIWYVENFSLALDLKIFFLTIEKVFKPDGVNQSKDQTMDKFRGEL